MLRGDIAYHCICMAEKDYSQKKLKESLGERCFPEVEQFFEKLGSGDWEHAMNPL